VSHPSVNVKRITTIPKWDRVISRLACVRKEW
jgi:hypothetical protein